MRIIDYENRNVEKKIDLWDKVNDKIDNEADKKTREKEYTWYLLLPLLLYSIIVKYTIIVEYKKKKS